ncbi:TM2 domain-containing protein [uncultured Shewanella sp.]|uniref:TM2 domain-containing protein n=1 Tax=Shewanella atlantica TaxID=271099 RepID=UPI00261132F3|nr:TM2 domain-containing protein [uncultured Shewanella sp.]
MKSSDGSFSHHKESQYRESQCTQCSHELAPGLVSCPQCHTAMGFEAFAGVDPNIRIKNQKLAIWFGFLFGCFGVHKFYLGQYLKGSLYLIFSWTLVPMVVGWIDAVRTMKMSSFNFEKRYCRRVAYY